MARRTPLIGYLYTRVSRHGAWISPKGHDRWMELTRLQSPARPSLERRRPRHPQARARRTARRYRASPGNRRDPSRVLVLRSRRLDRTRGPDGAWPRASESLSAGVERGRHRSAVARSRDRARRPHPVRRRRYPIDALGRGAIGLTRQPGTPSARYVARVMIPRRGGGQAGGDQRRRTGLPG